MIFGIVLDLNLVTFCTLVQNPQTAFGLHRRVRIAYPAVRETIALVSFSVDILFFFQCAPLR